MREIVMFIKELTSNASLCSVHSGIYLTRGNPVFTTIQNWYLDGIRNGVKPTPQVSRLLTSGILIGFNSNDFINPNSYKGAIKLFKCNSTSPKFHKKYFGKGIGTVHLLGFKTVDYDGSMNYLLASKMEFLHILRGKMIEEFPKYPTKLYDENHEYDRDWEYIGGLTPQEKIVLANLHGEEPFPNSFYENDRGMFSRRTQSDEFSMRLNSEISDIDVRDFEKDEFEDAFEKMDRVVREREFSLNEARDGFDYGDYQEFSDVYTRTSSRIEDYELYPIRVNCTPKSIKKKGRSPYDTKLGVRSYIWHNMWAKPEKLQTWKVRKSPKYDSQMSQEEKLTDEYDLPENFWEEIEMAYRNR